MNDLRKKIAQLFIIGFEGTTLPSDFEHTLTQLTPGGVILFDKNISTPAQLSALIQSIKAAASARPFISIDYEGGDVCRLVVKKGFSPTISMAQLAQLSQQERERMYRSMFETLNLLGIDLNFAPVVDLGLTSNIIKDKGRAYSDDPYEVIKHALEYIELSRSYRVLNCIKHFPGHGSAQGDTHEGFVDVTKHWTVKELIPYTRLAKEADTIMVAHVVNHIYDSKPASLSNRLVNDLLKTQLNFKGIVISDDLQMKAISTQYARTQAIMHTLNAGCDMIIFANQMGAPVTLEVLVEEVQSLIDAGLVLESRIEDAYQRIQAYKQKEEQTQIHHTYEAPALETDFVE